MNFSGPSNTRRLSRQETGASSSLTNDIQPSTSTTPSTPSRPITRSFLKHLNQSNNNSQEGTNSPLPSFSFLSSSNSSLNSMDISANQIDNGFNPNFSNNNFQISPEMFLNGKIPSFNFQNKKKEEDRTYQKILTSENPIGLIHFIENVKMNGRMKKNILNLPNSTLGFLTQRLKAHDYPLLLKRLDQSSIIHNLRQNSQELEDLIQVLRDIENRLINYSPNANDPDNMNEDENQSREEFEVETINVDSAITFRQYGGIDIFKRILLLSILTTEPTSDTNNSNNASGFCSKTTNETNNIGFEKCFILKIKCKVIHILNRLICLPHFGKLMVYDLLQYKPSQTQNSNNNSKLLIADYDTTLLQYLFSLLMFKEPRLQACQLIESILLHIPMLNLNLIQNLKLILETIDDDGLSCICKIFAVTLSNLDMADKKYLASSRRSQQQQQQPQTTSQIFNLNQNIHISQTHQQKVSESSSNLNYSIRDINQEFLLSIPSFLFRLVNLVRRKDYTVRFSGANNEIEHWIRYIDEALSDSDDNDLMDTTNSTSSLNHLENQLNQPALLAAAKLNNFVYVLYTLSLLLIGKEKKRVQKSLTKLRLANALNSLFDHLIWNCRCEYPNGSNQENQQQQQQQMRSHICPEVAVKIQFLRLVHSFCDHSEFKRVILSKDETEEILKYNREAQTCLQVNELILKIDNRVRCTKDCVGLLSKIVAVIKKEPFSASFRFWLIRAIESFLRGGTSYAEQLFLINRGVVEDTIQNILAVNFSRPKEVIQSCFDMLGELVKFNAKAFDIISNQLVENEKFNLLITMINQSLIDSNMFLRSVFLSIDFIDRNSEVLNYKISTNRVLAYFDSFDRRILFLSRMMNSINVHNLSQENISCLNTTLIVLMIAHRRKSLPKYLKALKSKSIELMLSSDFIHVNRDGNSTQRDSTPGAQSTDYMLNFKDLLLFWQSHYLQKDKDCAGLEQNSKIEFTFWKKIVELLLDTNHKNECSLNYYLQNDYLNMNSNRKTRIDDYRSD
ncbi:unnamed protein product [Brachionus calyciflorus]|uniref:Short transient receptor potential channel 4-associated protein n=1 Tax=Brachionus calyciflorus TaxID=104777 RepID=A0A813M6W6_9BILA|nr:unnamed protein product [Brachionus calyciflorus]